MRFEFDQQKFTAKSIGERILKIYWYLTKLMQKHNGTFYRIHGVEIFMINNLLLWLIILLFYMLRKIGVAWWRNR